MTASVNSSAPPNENIMIRLARNEDGERLKELLKDQLIFDMDWSDIYPYWLAAEKHGRVVGCLNISLGKPVGRLDFLGLDESLSPHARGRVVRALIIQGIAALKADGSQATLSIVPFELKSYKKVLKKHFGGIVASQGNAIMKRL